MDSISTPTYNQATLDAMKEAKRIARDPNVKGYTRMEDLKKALEETEKWATKKGIRRGCPFLLLVYFMVLSPC